MSRRLDLRWVFRVGGLVALVIAYAILWLKMLNDPVEYTGSDFITYYTVGVIANRYGFEHVYDFNLQKAVEEEIVGFEVADSNVMPHNHIPLLNPLLAILVTVTDEKYLLALCVWALILLQAYILAIWTLLRARPDRMDASPANLLAFLLFFPLFVSLMNGQDTVLLVLGAILLVSGVVKHKDWTAGLGLALMTVRPQIAVMLALPFLFTNRRIWWGFCAIACVFVLVSLAPLGLAGLNSFLDIMSTAVTGSRDTAMFNVIGFLSRALPSVSTSLIQAVGWVAYVLGIGGLCFLWKKARQVDERLLGLALILSLLLSPHLVYHDLTLLMVPLAIALWEAIGAEVLRRNDAAVVVLAVSVFLLLSFMHITMQRFVVYLFMDVLLVYLWQFPRLNYWLAAKMPPVVKESECRKR
jgi:hypothetical protein